MTDYFAQTFFFILFLVIFLTDLQLAPKCQLLLELFENFGAKFGSYGAKYRELFFLFINRSYDFILNLSQYSAY